MKIEDFFKINEKYKKQTEFYKSEFEQNFLNLKIPKQDIRIFMKNIANISIYYSIFDENNNKITFLNIVLKEKTNYSLIAKLFFKNFSNQKLILFFDYEKEFALAINIFKNYPDKNKINSKTITKWYLYNNNNLKINNIFSYQNMIINSISSLYDHYIKNIYFLSLGLNLNYYDKYLNLDQINNLNEIAKNHKLIKSLKEKQRKSNHSDNIKLSKEIDELCKKNKELEIKNF